MPRSPSNQPKPAIKGCTEETVLHTLQKQNPLLQIGCGTHNLTRVRKLFGCDECEQNRLNLSVTDVKKTTQKQKRKKKKGW